MLKDAPRRVISYNDCFYVTDVIVQFRAEKSHRVHRLCVPQKGLPQNVLLFDADNEEYAFR